MKTFSVYVERPTTSMFSNGEKREFCAEFEDKADAEDYVFDKFYYEQKFYNDSIRVAKTEEIAEQLQNIWNATSYYIVEE